MMNNQTKKKSKGKIIAIVVCIIAGIAVISYAVGGGKSDKSDKGDKQVSQSFEHSTLQSKSDTVQSESNNDSEKTVSKVVYDKDGIKITYKGTENNYNVTTSIKFLIENNNSEAYTIQTTDVTIDNYTMSTIMSTTVAAGKKANDKISLLNSDLKENGLSADTITNAEIGLVIWSESNILDQTKDKITFSLR